MIGCFVATSLPRLTRQLPTQGCARLRCVVQPPEARQGVGRKSLTVRMIRQRGGDAVAPSAALPKTIPNPSIMAPILNGSRIDPNLGFRARNKTEH